MIPIIPAIENNIINESNKLNVDKKIINYLVKKNQFNDFNSKNLINSIPSLYIIIEKLKTEIFFGLGLIGFIFIIFISLVLMATIAPIFIYIINDLIPNLIDFLTNILYLFIGFIALTIFIVPAVIIIVISWIFISIFGDEN